MRDSVFLVDDDQDVREAVTFLLTAEGLHVQAFESPSGILDYITPDHVGCLLLDVRLPGMNGLELQEALRERNIRLPVVFISGHGDIPMAVRAINAGALDFIEKPFNDELLLEKVNNALEISRTAREQQEDRLDVEKRLSTLTPREREVMEGILSGKLNKVIAYDMGVSVRTVEVHRAHLLEKLGARNSSDMVRLVLSTDAYRDWLL
ncbi:FixJ family two-component response regulator [Natronocella acetinitrilica]|uniref:FixJ family two-component response regulator n=1 Tax=Natronocella acetinitrilica TaxID=414046 RepID=A0AAE3KHM7_9GAMM|nr:response regulator [Natronocella acetinitrilica]MCP1676507.1 FixJ family two-component response regulator [Natronocella acetinitrilica]